MTIVEMRQYLGAEKPLSKAAFSRMYKIPVRTLEDWEAGKRVPPDYVLYLLERAVVVDSKLKDGGSNMRITIKTEGQNKKYFEKHNFNYEIGQVIDAEVKGLIQDTGNAYQIMEDGKAVSADKNGKAYLPLCNGLGDDGNRYALFLSDNNGSFTVSAFRDDSAAV